MRAKPLATSWLVLCLGVGSQALAASPDPADLVDKAAACRRRGKAECVLQAADKALEVLGESGKAGLRREALVMRAEALALLDRAEEAAEAFRAALQSWPGWRPPPDADVRVVKAFDDARAARILKALPKRLDAGPVPVPTLPETSKLTPEPLLYAPKRLVELEAPERRSRDFRLGIGGGVAIMGGASADRFDVGVSVTGELGYQVAEHWRVFLQASLSLHDFADDFPVEPGYGRGLTTVSIVVGGDFEYELIDDFSILLALGIGGGFFGVREATEMAGFSVQAYLGLRYMVGPALGIRLDAGPAMFMPVDAAVDFAIHLNVLARAEIHF